MAEIATWPKLKNQADVEAFLQDNIHGEAKADYIKLMHESGKSMGWDFTKPTLELQKQVVDGAHAQGRKTVAHATCLEDTLTVLRAGVDGLTHTFYDQPPTQELVNAYKVNNAWLNPTLVTIGSLAKDGLPAQEKFAEHPLVKKHVPQHAIEHMCKCIGFKAETSKLEYAYESVRMLKAAGVDIIIGSDAATPALGTAWGATVHMEMEIFVNECGFTPKEALRAATALTAKRFGFGDRGLLEEGRRADLLLVEGNPLEDVTKSLEIKGVWKKGEMCSAYA